MIKLGELVELTPSNVQSYESVISDAQINERFQKFANTLKRIAPKADDFLYFTSIMLHSAEASLINADGSRKKRADGSLVEAHWDIDKKGSWKWISNDPSVRAYKNNNGDIFPAQELLKAYKDWVGKPLCVDHKSASVDAIRGVILDTYYDRAFHRVIGLCALDKVSYPELARKVSTGYSASVSMGTGVKQAICYDCGTVASSEPEFCHHMKNKSCYGEINVGLQPIELSIVVNGADPQAKIRTILAAANSINDRLAETEQTLTNLSDTDQQAKVQELENVLKEANEKLDEIKDSLSTNKVDLPYGQTSGGYADPTDETDENAQNLNIPERYAHNQELLGELSNLKLSIEAKLSNMEKLLLNKEENMTDSINKEGYFQGGGGVNEPTPGQKKYPVDPLNEKLRAHEDKQMVGQKPFPDVGAVDGLHPSPESVEPKDELERKKMLSRAERRATALKSAKENIANRKEAYYQGGGGVNEPALHQVKYTKDPLNEKLRAHEDKQMVGQKPFPEVGAVDGLHPSPESAEQKDELERKKLLQRASYKAKFVRLANVDGTDNLGASGWRVYEKDEAGDKLVFTATVDEISGGRSDALFDVVATKDFGKKLLEKISSVGIEKAKSMYKQAQAVTQPGTMPAAPADAGGAGPVPDMSAALAPLDAPSDEKDEGGKGDPKEATMRLAEEARDVTSDLLEAVRKLTGEQAEMGDMEEGLSALPKAASETILPLSKMRRELNASLISAMKKSVAELKDHAEELQLVANVLEDTAPKAQHLKSAIEDAITDAGKTVADAQTLKQAYNKYINGTQGLMKQAEEAEEKSMSGDCDMVNDVADPDEDLGLGGDELDLELGDRDTDLDLGLGHEMHDEEDGDRDTDLDLNLDLGEGHDHEDVNDTMVDLPAGTPIPSTAKAVSPTPGALQQGKVAYDLSTKEGRAAYRVKLAKDATGKEDSGEVQAAEKVPFSDMLDAANRLTDGQTKLEVKPSDELGKVETLPEVNKKMLEVARMPPKVKKEAERLNQLIANGSVNPKDLDALVAQGLDGEVVKYWRQFYGEAGKEGSEFAKMLTSETAKAKQAEEMSVYRTKLARAYELTNEMVKRGLCSEDRHAVSAQVDALMDCNDAGFESLKRIVASHAPKMHKQASMPYVGILNDDAAPVKHSVDLQSELDQAFSTKRFGY